MLGVDPQQLIDKEAFTFAKGDGWELLNGTDGGAVPVVVDMNTGMWALHVKVGDEMEYPNEAGGTFPIRIVGFLANPCSKGT